jgi:hypothetical protein
MEALFVAAALWHERKEDEGQNLTRRRDAMNTTELATNLANITTALKKAVADLAALQRSAATTDISANQDCLRWAVHYLEQVNSGNISLGDRDECLHYANEAMELAESIVTVLEDENESDN